MTALTIRWNMKNLYDAWLQKIKQQGIALKKGCGYENLQPRNSCHDAARRQRLQAAFDEAGAGLRELRSSPILGKLGLITLNDLQPAGLG